MCILYPFCQVILYQYFRWHCSFLVEFCTYFVYKESKNMYKEINFVCIFCTQNLYTWSNFVYEFCIHFVKSFCIPIFVPILYPKFVPGRFSRWYCHFPNKRDRNIMHTRKALVAKRLRSRKPNRSESIICMYDSYLSDAQRRASTGSDAAHPRTISPPWRKKENVQTCAAPSCVMLRRWNSVEIKIYTSINRSIKVWWKISKRRAMLARINLRK